MASSFQRSFRILLLAVLTIPASAAPFEPPGEVAPPFRRDRIPLDNGAMVRLAKNLITLTESSSFESPGRRRAAAQALALALALDPSNSAARSHLSTLEEGRNLPGPDEGKLEKARNGIWRTMAWFAAPEAGPDGNLLAELMGDALSVLDSEHPAADTLRENSGQGKWDGWIAPLSAFKDRPERTVPSDPVDDEVTEKVTGKGPSVVLKDAELSTVLYSYDKNLKLWSPELTTVRMEGSTASPDPEDEGGGEFGIAIPSRPGEEDLIDSRVADPIAEAMETYLGALPDRGIVTLFAGRDGIYQFRRNRTLLTGPGFLLATASATGNAPQGTVIAELDDSNGLNLPKHFWRLLMLLSESEKSGGRLVLPATAEEYLVSLLALEKPDFFLKHEILLASSPAQLVALSAGNPPEEHSEVFGKFAEIVEKSEGNPIGPYLANRFVRQRLQEIIDVAPYHLSAKLLARQGAGMRPRYLSRKVLAAEIWRSVDLVSELEKLDLYFLDAGRLNRLEELHDEMRADVDALERYADSRDRELVEEGKDLATAVKTLARKIRTKGRDFYGDGYSDISEARREMASKNADLRRKLSEISGDPLTGGGGGN